QSPHPGEQLFLEGFMRCLLALAFLWLPLSASAGSPSFTETPEGEIASDRASDLEEVPEFRWTMDPFLKLPGFYSRPSEEEAKAYVLQATMVKDGIPAAVLNDRV